MEERLNGGTLKQTAAGSARSVPPSLDDAGDSDDSDDASSASGDTVDVNGEQMYVIEHIVKAKGTGRSRK